MRIAIGISLVLEEIYMLTKEVVGKIFLTLIIIIIMITFAKIMVVSWPSMKLKKLKSLV